MNIKIYFNAEIHITRPTISLHTSLTRKLVFNNVNVVLTPGNIIKYSGGISSLNLIFLLVANFQKVGKWSTIRIWVVKSIKIIPTNQLTVDTA